MDNIIINRFLNRAFSYVISFWLFQVMKMGLFAFVTSKTLNNLF